MKHGTNFISLIIVRVFQPSGTSHKQNELMLSAFMLFFHKGKNVYASLNGSNTSCSVGCSYHPGKADKLRGNFASWICAIFNHSFYLC